MKMIDIMINSISYLDYQSRSQVNGITRWRHQIMRYLPFMRGIPRWPVDSHHKGQWRGALMFSLICAWTNGWASNQDAGELRRNCAYYDVTVILLYFIPAANPATPVQQGHSWMFWCIQILQLWKVKHLLGALNLAIKSERIIIRWQESWFQLTALNFLTDC